MGKKRVKRMELYFSDLNEEGRKKVMEFFEIETPGGLNEDVVPLATLEVEVEDFGREG
ncbi:MAG: hypothetical protein QXQ53_01260 [Candidatus Methanosuratincola sp.]